MDRRMGTSLHELLVRGARNALALQRPDGSFPPGNNGPYGDPQTPVRNTADWLLVLLRAAAIARDDTLREAADDATDYLLESDRRPHNATFHCRDAAGKDACNGLLGQAVAIEALVQAGRILERPECLDLAESVFLLHPFDDWAGVWQRVEINGDVLSLDRTLNHQIWFAAAGGELAAVTEHGTVGRQVKRFLDVLPSNVAVAPSGRIKHRLRPHLRPSDVPRLLSKRRRWSLAINPAMDAIRWGERDRRMTEREIGYHAVNLYALAKLRETYPNHGVWGYRSIEAALSYLRSREYRAATRENVRCYTHTPTGFQNAYVLDAFGIGTGDDRKSWIVEQLRRGDGTGIEDLLRGDLDEETSSQLYAATRLPDLELPQDRIET